MDPFVVFGDAFRRDEIDATHYPVFHQMEAVRIYKSEEFTSNNKEVKRFEIVEDLK